MSNVISFPVKAQDRARTDTPGRRQLVAFLTRPRRHCTQRKLAKILGVNQGAVSEWVRGLSRPTVSKALFLWKLCGIPMEAWCTEAELKELQRAEFEAYKLAAEPEVETAQEKAKRIADKQLLMPYMATATGVAS